MARPVPGFKKYGTGVFIAVFALIGCISGCNPKSSMAQVHGKVLLDGKPLTKGQVATLPVAGRGSNGIIQPDGTFTLKTFGTDDGAAIGTHKVAVVAYEGQTRGPEAGNGSLLVPQRYINPETSGLTIEVVSGTNTPTLELTTK